MQKATDAEGIPDWGRAPGYKKLRPWIIRRITRNCIKKAIIQNWIIALKNPLNYVVLASPQLFEHFLEKTFLFSVINILAGASCSGDARHVFE